MNDKIARLTEELRSALAEEDAVKNYIAAKAAYIADEKKKPTRCFWIP